MKCYEAFRSSFTYNDKFSIFQTESENCEGVFLENSSNKEKKALPRNFLEENNFHSDSRVAFQRFLLNFIQISILIKW